MKQYGMPVFGTVQEANPAAQTTHGAVRGENRQGIAIFRGIPYGGACEGAGRFLPPVPAEDWSGVRDCTRNGYCAVQNGGSISGSEGLGAYFSGGRPELFGVAEEKQGENCLVLNVLTPGVDDRRRPVVVYIHGGGFATGSGTLVLGADRWAREEDLVIVGVNHRLNVFGYLYLGAFDESYAQSGMAGMLDLVLALEWVRDNIAAFGGDPDRGTIMGESGGGMKVSTLLAMDKAAGLFHRAIVESGSDIVGRKSTQEAAAFAEKVLERLSIPTDNIRGLAEVPAEQLLAVAAELSETNLMQLAPVADTVNLAYHAAPCYYAPVQSAQVPLLVGASEDELAVFVAPVIENGSLEDTLVRCIRGMDERLPFVSVADAGQARRVVEAFKRADRKGVSQEHLLLRMLSTAGILGGGAYYQALAKAEQGGAPVYHYVVAYDSILPGTADKRCAWHTADLPLQMRIVLNPESERLSRIMAHAWAAFIRTGDPSAEELPWPAFTAAEKQVMVFDESCRVETDPWKELREALEGK